MNTERPLFGGAISCQIPADWRDISDIRQVPDHQECWQDHEGRLLVVEILERQSVSDEQAAAYFFQDLAGANGVAPEDMQFTPQPQVLHVQGLPDNAVSCYGNGFQKVAMGREFDVGGHRREQEIHWIRVELCAIRLPSLRSDLLVTLSTPSASNPNEPDEGNQSTDFFRSVLSSLQIRDWSLFGH